MLQLCPILFDEVIDVLCVDHLNIPIYFVYPLQTTLEGY